jgi:hypothetical protein
MKEGEIVIKEFFFHVTQDVSCSGLMLWGRVCELEGWRGENWWAVGGFSLTTCACPVESAEPAAKLHSTGSAGGAVQDRIIY